MFILTDQQRYDAVGYVNNKVITPNLNELAKKSVDCRQTVVQCPQCQPSRASIFTGKYPTTLKMWWNEVDISSSERTIGNILKDNGYETGYFGKIHFSGKGSHRDVAKHFGFDNIFLYEDWINLMNAKTTGIPRSENRVLSEFYEIMSKEPWVGKFSGRELHHDEMIVDKAIKFIKDNTPSHKPYFCVVGFHGPHPPYASPPPFCDMYDEESFTVPEVMRHTYSGHLMTDCDWRSLKAQYFGSITWIDDNIGKLLKYVDDDTIIVFTSDHGDILGDHGYFSKGVFAYEGNIRVPLLIRLPNNNPVVYDHIVQSIDVAPTLLEAVGVAKQDGMQGVSLLNDFAINRRRNQFAFSCIGYGHRLRMIRTYDHKYWLLNGDEVLFNIADDPFESNNLFNTCKDTVSQMRKMLLNAIITAEDPLPRPKI